MNIFEPIKKNKTLITVLSLIFWIALGFVLLFSGPQGCTGVHIKHSTAIDPATNITTYTTEYDRSVWVNQNIEGLDVSIDPKTGVVHATLKGQSSESTALNNAITTMGNLTGMAMKVLEKGAVAP